MTEPDFTPGRWAVVKDWSASALNPEIYQIEKETNSLIISGRLRKVKVKVDVLATFATLEEAQGLVNALHGIRGERDRRVKAAEKAAHEAVAKVMAALQ